MRKVLCIVLVGAIMSVGLCTKAEAVKGDRAPIMKEHNEIESFCTRATGSFDITVNAGAIAEADVAFPMAAGETVRIRANYAPENASMDFGLIDPDGVFHYINVTTGSIDKTIEVPENGNYTFAMRNNSDKAVKVSGIVRY